MTRAISIVGAGRVGRTLGKRLRQLGWRIGAVVTRSTVASRAAVRAIGAGTPLAITPNSLKAVPKGVSAPEANAFSLALATDVILVAVPDDAIKNVARTLAQAGGPACRGKIVLHTSGALDRSALAPLARRGAATGSLHPMQTFTGRGAPELRGVTFAIEGDLGARRAAQKIARALGGVPVIIAGRDKPTYHATAVLVCGSAFPLIESALQMLARIGFTRSRALRALLPLTRQMLDNVERLGPRAAWTGPLARGDYAVVARHAKALRRYPREVRQAYAALAFLAARVLARNPARAMQQIERALKRPAFAARKGH
jgi:predicted short-subunit dehydrogenase-like oxidoreductase (DUF2520 family)